MHCMVCPFTPSFHWYSSTDPGRMAHWVDVGTQQPRVCRQDICNHRTKPLAAVTVRGMTCICSPVSKQTTQAQHTPTGQPQYQLTVWTRQPCDWSYSHCSVHFLFVGGQAVLYTRLHCGWAASHGASCAGESATFPRYSTHKLTSVLECWMTAAPSRGDMPVWHTAQ